MSASPSTSPAVSEFVRKAREWVRRLDIMDDSAMPIGLREAMQVFHEAMVLFPPSTFAEPHGTDMARDVSAQAFRMFTPDTAVILSLEDNRFDDPGQVTRACQLLNQYEWNICSVRIVAVVEEWVDAFYLGQGEGPVFSLLSDPVVPEEKRLRARRVIELG